MTNRAAKTDKKSGFTMVEVALAMMVMTVGLLGVFALFPVGLNSSRDAKLDTQMAMLAQAVFGDFREWSEENWQPGGTFWTGYPGYRMFENAPSEEWVRPGHFATVRREGVNGAEGVPICGVTMTVDDMGNGDLFQVQLVMNPGRTVRDQGAVSDPNADPDNRRRAFRQVTFLTRVARYEAFENDQGTPRP